jgi:hypothetical protein
MTLDEKIKSLDKTPSGLRTAVVEKHSIDTLF